MNNFVQDLPHSLKVEVSLYIYEERYKKLKFFKDRSPTFISWLCPLLKPQYFADDQYIYLEGDDVKHIFFLIDGLASFVLPSYDNTRYIDIEVGDNFGMIDIIGSTRTQDFEMNEWYEKKNQLKRQFSVMAINNVVIQILSMQDLFRMEQEFESCFESMVTESNCLLSPSLQQKLSAMKTCSKQQQEMKMLNFKRKRDHVKMFDDDTKKDGS